MRSPDLAPGLAWAPCLMMRPKKSREATDGLGRLTLRPVVNCNKYKAGRIPASSKPLSKEQNPTNRTRTRPTRRRLFLFGFAMKRARGWEQDISMRMGPQSFVTSKNRLPSPPLQDSNRHEHGRESKGVSKGRSGRTLRSTVPGLEFGIGGGVPEGVVTMDD